MGIPFYFGEVIAKSPSSRRFQTITSNIPYQCARLFMDYNSIIHMCSANVVSQCKSDAMQLEKHIFDYIAKYTLELIGYAKPTDTVYIAIDGVAPRAKMSQQRKRRYLSAQRNNAIEDFKRQHGIPYIKWDSNCITPGTDFMHRLAVFLENDFKLLLQNNFPNIGNLIISTAEEQGEGEHKMIQYIKAHPYCSDVYCDVVYGLDADLIMLSLTCDKNNIVLMRESQNFIHERGENKTPFKYLVIERLRESIVDTFGATIDDVSIKQLVFDYVFMCFFLGNDFIPSLSFMKIQESAVDVLMNIYKKVCTDKRLLNFVNNQYIINLDILERFLNELKAVEDDLMTKAHEQYFNTIVHPPRNFNNIVNIIRQQHSHTSLKEAQSKAVKEFVNDLEKFPLRNKPSYTIDPRNDVKWRNSYYHCVFGANSPELITDTCSNYIDGLIWTTNYYFNQKSNHEWYYRYSYAPCASDMYKHVVSSQPEDLITKHAHLMESSAKVVTPQLQLLMVLPPQSVELLPKHLQPLMKDIKNGCLHYYPINFSTLTYLKTKGWECIPKLPLIDMKRLQSLSEVL